MPSRDANGKTTWSTTELVTAVALAVATAAAGGVWVGHKIASKDFDEDRPPIIVSNGSVDFDGKNGHPHNNDAYWEEFPAGQKRVFKHYQPNGIKVKSFTLDTVPAYDATDPTKTISSCTLNNVPTNSRPPFTLGTSVSVFYSTAGDPSTMYESKFAIGGNDELVLTLVAEDGEIQGGGKKIKVKDINNSPPNRKIVRSFSYGNYSCILNNQGSTSVEVKQEKY
jgi:hypothetical protein